MGKKKSDTPDNWPVCKDKRICFAQEDVFFKTKCSILRESYDDGKCPFCKPDKEVTKGKKYPRNPGYAGN